MSFAYANRYNFTYHREQATIDTKKTLLLYYADCSVNKTTVLWIRPFCIVNQFGSIVMLWMNMTDRLKLADKRVLYCFRWRDCEDRFRHSSAETSYHEWVRTM